jgi:hypothetical protein
MVPQPLRYRHAQIAVIYDHNMNRGSAGVSFCLRKKKRKCLFKV